MTTRRTVRKQSDRNRSSQASTQSGDEQAAMAGCSAPADRSSVAGQGVREREYQGSLHASGPSVRLGAGEPERGGGPGGQGTAVSASRIQRQDDGRQNQPAPNDTQTNQGQQNQVQRQQGGGQGEGRPMDVTGQQTNKFAATVKAEAGSQGQERAIRWVYYNLVHRRDTFQDGLSRSAAYADSSFWYCYWLMLLEFDLNDNTRQLGQNADHDCLDTPAPGDPDTLRDFINAGVPTGRTARDAQRAEATRSDVEDMFNDRAAQQYENFTGQGNEDDLNRGTRAWQRARRYYRLQEGLAEKEDESSDDVQTDVIRVIRDGGDPQVIMKWQEITDYFNANPQEDPRNHDDPPPQVDL